MISFLLVSFLFIWAFYFKNGYDAFLFLPSVFFYFFAYEVREAEFVSNYFQFAIVEDYSLYLFNGILIFSSCLIGFSPLVNVKLINFGFFFNKSTNVFIVDFLKVQFLYYALSFFSISAFVLNFSNVDFSIGLLLIAPRLYEETFGSSTFLNYIYFLNIPALCLYLYAVNYNLKIKYSFLINFVLILISFFHGIKFTVFDTVLFPLFFYFNLKGFSRKVLITIFFVFLFLLAFYLIFSFGVRGNYGGNDSFVVSFLNYILPNYYNLAYSFEKTPIQWDFISPFLPDKLPSPSYFFFLYGPYGFVLNDSFNMSTAFNIYFSVLPFISTIFLFPLIIWIRKSLLFTHSKFKNISYVFLIAYFDFCIFFSWYFFAFNKTKYVFYVFLFLILSFIIHSRFKFSTIK